MHTACCREETIHIPGRNDTYSTEVDGRHEYDEALYQQYLVRSLDLNSSLNETLPSKNRSETTAAQAESQLLRAMFEGFEGADGELGEAGLSHAVSHTGAFEEEPAAKRPRSE
jgi:hypothetical protein